MKVYMTHFLSFLKTTPCFFFSAVILLCSNNFIYARSRGSQGGLRSVRTFSGGRSIAKTSMVESFDYTVEMFPNRGYTGAWFYWSNGGHLTAHFRLTTKDPGWLKVNPLTFSSDSCEEIARIEFTFNAPGTTGEYVDTLVDTTGNWDNTVVTLRVTNSPAADGPFYADEIVADAKSDTVTRTYYNFATPLGCVEHYAPVSSSIFQFYLQPDVPWMSFEENTDLFFLDIATDDSATLSYVFSNDTTGDRSTYLTEYRGSGEHSYPNYYLFFRSSPLGIARNLNSDKIPAKFNLLQNYPNPFNPSTSIKFSLPKSEFTTLKVFNALGRQVATVVSNKLTQGNHTFIFNGKNLASGIYYYQLAAGEYRKVKKMILLK